MLFTCTFLHEYQIKVDEIQQSGEQQDDTYCREYMELLLVPPLIDTVNGTSQSRPVQVFVGYQLELVTSPARIGRTYRASDPARCGDLLQVGSGCEGVELDRHP